jgi:PLP dependent protein
MTETQTHYIQENVDRIRERIAAACSRSGRSQDDVTLVAVSKTFPIEAVEAAREAGITHFAENRVQDFIAKTDSIPGRVEGGDVAWHMVGHLQRNKAKDVVARADFFDALDSIRLATEIDKRAEAAGRVMPCLVQVNVSGEESKFGFEPEEFESVLDQLEEMESIKVLGLMTLAAPADDPEEVRPQFALLRTLLEKGKARPSFASMNALSMGMSGDFEVAIEEGATHVRIGSAVFGEREG